MNQARKIRPGLEQQRLSSAQLKSQENFDTSQFAKSATKLFDDLIRAKQNRNVNEPFEQKKFKKRKKETTKFRDGVAIICFTIISAFVL
jgi:hypothetical protein